jgi:hypothetical protein
MAMPAVRGGLRVPLLVAGGVFLGLVYTLSPLSVIALGVVVAASRAASQGLSATERRWFWSLIAAALLVRLAAIALLFLTADPARPFASFFGDEELYKFRSVWVRNVGLGIPISPADVIYGFDAVGRTGHMYVLAFVQALVGDAPYGLHMLNMMLSLCGVLALYRVARAAYGPAVSITGLAALLLLPTLVAWSISVLKEPMNMFVLAGEFVCAVAIVRAPRLWQKAIAAAGVVLFALAMESLRAGGVVTAALGTLGGLALAFVIARGRRLMIAMLVAPLAIAVLAGVPQLQDRAMASLRNAAYYHSGHVLTAGISYHLVNPGYYANRAHVLYYLSPVETARYVVTAGWSYFVQPVPWKMESRALRAYLPEQLIWYAMALLLPFGVVAGMRRDRLITSMLLAHSAAAIVIVALTSGNIGTLIRHRSLALPYLIWLSALGGYECVRLFLDRYRVAPERSGVDGDR